MPGRNYSNTVSNSITTASTMNAAQTTMTVSNGTTFPAPDFTIQVGNEVMLVTGTSGASSTALTVTRAFDGTTATVHPSSTGVSHVVVAADFGVSVPQWMIDLAVRPATPHSYDDEFDDDSLDAAWTAIAPAGGTVTPTESRGLLSVKYSGIASDDGGGISRSLGALTAPVTIETFVKYSGMSVNYNMVGLFFADGTTSTDNTASVRWYNDLMSYQSGTWTDNDVGGQAGIGISYMQPGGLYIRLIWKSANTFALTFSGDGINWTRGNLASTFSRTMTPTHFGLWVSNWGSGVEGIATYEYFRVYESDLS